MASRSAALAVTALLLAALAPSAHAAFPGRNGRIAVFKYGEREGDQISTITPSGRGERVLPCALPPGPYNNLCEDSWPRYSPDGRRIARLVGGTYSRIAISDSDGGNPRVYPFDHESNGFPGVPYWAPDGRSVMFFSSPYVAPGGGPGATFRLDADGTYTRLPFSEVPVGWSSTNWIAFGRAEGPEGSETYGLFRARPDGSHVRRIARNASWGFGDWSPHGTKFLFMRVHAARGGVHSDIHIRHVKGGREKRVVHDAGGPVWSPDGKWIAYNTFGKDSLPSAIYKIRTDGTHRRRLLLRDGAYLVAWQPLPKRR